MFAQFLHLIMLNPHDTKLPQHLLCQYLRNQPFPSFAKPSRYLMKFTEEFEAKRRSQGERGTEG